SCARFPDRLATPAPRSRRCGRSMRTIRIRPGQRRWRWPVGSRPAPARRRRGRRSRCGSPRGLRSARHPPDQRRRRRRRRTTTRAKRASPRWRRRRPRPRGVREKDLALAIAKKVAARLKALGFQVLMTRARDVFVSLDERTRIANEARADLFVSIHCNAARRRRLEGVETWTLNVASNRYAARLAAFENAEADRTVSDLRLILADLATKANASDARDLAQSVQSSLVRTLRSRVGPLRDHGVKQP